MIQLEDLSVRYGPVPALEAITLSIEAGEFVLVSGPSGCGKSTLALALSGLIPHSLPAQMDGKLRVHGLDTRRHSIPELAQIVGTVFQNPASQLFHLQVQEEIAFGPRNLDLDEAEVDRRVTWALEATGIEALRLRNPAELSHGQKQRVAIAAVLAMKPKILVLDEPTASLDVMGTHLLMKTLKDLNQNYGVTIVLIEHRLADAVKLAHRVILMEGGRIVADGKTGQILSDAGLRKQLGLRRPPLEPMSRWSSLIASNGHNGANGDPILTMSGVSAGYNRSLILQDLDLTLYSGDFTALVGENGVGKSTLGLLAAGLLKPKEGQLRFGGGSRPRPGLDVAMLFQVPCDQLFTNSVDDEVGFAAHNYGMYDEATHTQILAQADLLALRPRRPLALSVGQQQRTALAACLATRPKLLILDEPTMGQDWGHLQRLMNFLTALNRQGTAIMLITHDYKLIHRYAHRIMLMKHGRIIADGRIRVPEEASAHVPS